MKFSAGCALFFLLGLPLLRAQSPRIDEPAPHAIEGDDIDELSAMAAEMDSGAPGVVPVSKGFNASMATISQHDSIIGWSSFLMPNLAYRFNRHLSVNVGAPIYLYVNIYSNTGTKARPKYAYKPKNGSVGDTVLTVEGDAGLKSVGYIGTFTLGMPSGNTDYGLGAGQCTFGFNQHIEKSVGRSTPDVEVGYSDTSNLVDRRILKNYIAVGPMAHFQAGTTVALPLRMSFEANAYEELPLAKNIVYSTSGKGKKRVRTGTNHDPTEDNGFISSLDLPLSPNITLSGFYTRSLRDRDDIGGFSFTFMLKGTKRETKR